MLAEIFQESIKQNKSSDWEECKEFLKETREKPKLSEKMEIKELYDMFIEKKRDIYIYKGNPSGNSAPNMALIDHFDESHKYHRRLALEVILHKDRRLFSCYQQSCKDINESVLKIGIVQRTNDEPQFIHRTFAEYFVAESLVHELQAQLHSPDIKFQEFFVGKVLQLPENVIIRGFLDNFLNRVVDSEPANILEKYESHTCDQCCWMDDHRFIHLLAEEGCIAILQLVLKCVNFKIVRGKEINIEDLTSYDFDNNRSVSQALLRKIRVNKIERKENVLLFTRIITQEAGINIRDRFGSTLLYYAADGGHFEMVRFLTEQGADINSAGYMGCTALHCAASDGHLDIVEYLVKSNHDIDIQNVDRRTALHFAAAKGHLDTVKLLHRLGADLNVTDFDGGTALHSAVSGHHLDTVKYLLELGADFDVENNYQRTPLRLAAIYGFSDIVKFLFELGADLSVTNYEDNTASHLTAFFGRLDAIKILHELGHQRRQGPHAAAFSSWGWSIAWAGHLDTVEFLHGLGTDLNVRDNEDSTLLHLAVARGQLVVVKFLVNLVGDVNIRDLNARTPLHLAAWASHLDTVKFLHGLGTDLNVRDNDESTPLHLATVSGNLGAIKFLLKVGGDLRIRNKDGRTPLQLARYKGHRQIVNYFKNMNRTTLKVGMGIRKKK
ncbi:ankyrin repeat, PH and SEC7 domain containing protein secG-like [Anoplophora glabripennis]|uniref:ankyrin repeat, PH and SEC7 domain containing protein secG-like n=1 Tax=Anoplophora glabripennis TaxID=217634 RepID=UPI0008746F77|nr:ankyrin repeat, PH and SEC7 domain containing protein secG-like [Anoplophora glabripennis]